MGGATFWHLLMLPFQFGNLVLAEKGEKLEIPNHVPIIRLNPELVKLVDAGLFGVEPNGTFGRLSKF